MQEEDTRVINYLIIKLVYDKKYSDIWNGLGRQWDIKYL